MSNPTRHLKSWRRAHENLNKGITMEVRYADETSTQVELTPELALSADQEIVGRAFSGYTKPLYLAALRVLGSREDAEDAVQDGLLAATRSLKSFEGRSKFSTWLTRVVINAALLQRRKMHGHTITSIDQSNPDEQGLPVAVQLADTRPNPEEAYLRYEQRATVKRCLQTLPASYRSALWLRHIEGMNTQEAADVLGVSEGTLKSRLHRARVKLSKRVREVSGTGELGNLGS
jgi:RNA polymerase sigma-70 factor, ECF subfamily